MDLDRLKSVPVTGILAIPTVVFVAHIAVGTSLAFASAFFVYLVAAILAFNWAGGAHTIGGMIVATMTIRNTLAQVGKVVLGQAGESNLASGELTVLVLAWGTGAIALAALASRYLFPPAGRAILGVETGSGRLLTLVRVFLAIRILMFFADRTGVTSGLALGGVVAGILSNLGFVPIACIALGTAYHLVESGKTRSLGWANLTHLVIAVIDTLQFGYKQALVFPILTYLLTCVAYRRPFKRLEIVAIAASVIVLLPALYTYSMVARSGIARNGQTAGEAVLDLMTEPGANLKEVLEIVDAKNALSREIGYYGSPMGVLDRVAVPMFNAAQAVSMADRRGDLGLEGIGSYFTFLPKSLTGVSSSFSLRGDILGQFADIIDSSNQRTGIEMDPTIASYAFGQWLGVTLLSFVSFGLFFAATNLVFGTISRNPWAITSMMANFLVLTSANVAFLVTFVLRGVPFMLLLLFLLGQLDKRERGADA